MGKVFVWDANSNQTFDSTYGNQTLTNQYGFEKNKPYSFTMDAPATSLFLKSEIKDDNSGSGLRFHYPTSLIVKDGQLVSSTDVMHFQKSPDWSFPTTSSLFGELTMTGGALTVEVINKTGIKNIATTYMAIGWSYVDGEDDVPLIVNLSGNAAFKVENMCCGRDRGIFKRLPFIIRDEAWASFSVDLAYYTQPDSSVYGIDQNGMLAGFDFIVDSSPDSGSFPGLIIDVPNGNETFTQVIGDLYPFHTITASKHSHVVTNLLAYRDLFTENAPRCYTAKDNAQIRINVSGIMNYPSNATYSVDNAASIIFEAKDAFDIMSGADSYPKGMFNFYSSGRGVSNAGFYFKQFNAFMLTALLQNGVIAVDDVPVDVNTSNYRFNFTTVNGYIKLYLI